MKMIPLTQGKFAIVDDADYEKVRGFRWYAQKAGRSFYAQRNVLLADGKRALLLLHRFLTNCPPELEVNHINGDGLDNGRENLQVCTHQQNQFAYRRKKKSASSEYRGVNWYPRTKRWVARIRHNDTVIHLGYFGSEEAAARAYDSVAKKLFGEFACPNFN